MYNSVTYYPYPGSSGRSSRPPGSDDSQGCLNWGGLLQRQHLQPPSGGVGRPISVNITSYVVFSLEMAASAVVSSCRTVSWCNIWSCEGLLFASIWAYGTSKDLPPRPWRTSPSHRLQHSTRVIHLWRTFSSGMMNSRWSHVVIDSRGLNLGPGVVQMRGLQTHSAGVTAYRRAAIPRPTRWWCSTHLRPLILYT